VRRGDTVARLGGDEFVVMSEQLAGEDDARLFGERLLGAFDTPFDIDPHSFRVGGTIGYALSPADASDAVTLLKFADAAMYLGKESGKGCLRRGGAASLREASSSEGDLAWSPPPEGQPSA
jgi:diguanylate cyclase (GGDEF)-like protein